MLVERNGAQLSLVGILDESVALDEVKQEIEAACQEKGAVVYVDMAKLQRINSHGLRVWMAACQGISKKLTYQRCPFFFIELLNYSSEYLSKDFFPLGVFVESFEVPFVCEETDEIVTHLLTMGVEIPLKTDGSDVALAPIEVDGKIFEPCFEPEEFLQFLDHVA